MDSFKAFTFCLLVIISMNNGRCSGYELEMAVDPVEMNCSSECQCNSDEYEVTLSNTDYRNFPERRCYTPINRNRRIKFYVCFKCSVCDPLPVLIKCGRKHDTICLTNCTKPNEIFDEILKRCIPKVLTTAFAGLPTSGHFNPTLDSTIVHNHRFRGFTVLTVGLGLVNISVLMMCFTAMRRRLSKNVAQTIDSSTTVRNATTVNVVSEKNSSTDANDTNIIGVVMNCDMSVGPAQLQKNVITTSKKTLDHNPFWLEMKATLGPEGGIVSDSRSGVSLIVPLGAIPDTHSKQEIIVRVSLKPSNFGLHQENDRYTLSPVVECLSPGLQRFNSCVTLVVPHRAKLDPDWKFYVMHTEDKYSDPKSKFQWTVTGNKHYNTEDVHFEVDENVFRIKTTHFTTYVCAGCSRKAPLNLQVVVHGGYSNIDGNRQRVDLRCYVCDTIKDYSQMLQKHEPNHPLCVPMPINRFISKKTKYITISLPENDFGKEWPWTCETFHGSLPNERIIDIMHTARCCSDLMPHYETFTLKPKREDMQVEFLETTFKIISNGMTGIIGPIRIKTMNTDISAVRNDFVPLYTDIVSSEKLREISHAIPLNKWKDVYRTLYHLSGFEGFPNTDIENLEYNNRGQVEEMKYQALMLWHTKAGRNASTNMLVQALKECELNQVVFSYFKKESNI